MLNISQNSVEGLVSKEELRSPGSVRAWQIKKNVQRLLIAFSALAVIVLCLPWTQNVPGTGRVTTLKPDQRPQELHSAIAGRIEEWFVREGDFVERGDTLLFISEVKGEYFDPSLLARTESQIEAKSFSVNSYKEKVEALDKRINALTTSKSLKLQQAQNKVAQAKLKIRSDSIELAAAKTNYSIAERQYERMQQLYDEGLKSLTDLEKRKLKLQETQAKLVAAENYLLTSQNELLNYQVDLSGIANEYDEKIAKAKAEKFETLSSQYDAEAQVTKLQSNYANYTVRAGMYYIKAPQAGYVTQTLKTGIGETIKAGEEILTIMPSGYDLAVEMYIEPRDLPLVSKGTEVRLVFDGWPAMVFSGWPGASTGTFGGTVVAVDNFASTNGKFRMLVAPDPGEEPWPAALRVGSGAKGIAMLNDVPIAYEIWRQLNGFPPEYYEEQPAINKKSKDKTKIKDPSNTLIKKPKGK